MTTRPTISVSVKGGRFNVCDVTFAPSGKSTITYIKKGLTASEAIDCLKSL